ncbi:uncharacterized protein EV420DRAFT_1543755 [Desarmillaria tabescens]|uniref:Uncharacterized protein n=1 Tax=Armillaria tabescens TaxID=1929756 RepID=A0AA39KG38_ARMTA|nr:uncharacterized protein EV420DRAFT_1543755 [Desarmillaria tabescens]KAK0458143.1 hypothetical protein EV420DRAFT_1543755 [Desarmillaria tabescens]
MLLATSRESIQALVKTISKQEKDIDIMVNDVGTATQTADAKKGEMAQKDLAKEMWQLMLDAWLDTYIKGRVLDPPQHRLWPRAY